MTDQKIIPVAEITKGDRDAAAAIIAECENHKACQVEKKAVDKVDCLIFPADCDEKCRKRIARQMNWAFGGG